MFTLNENYVVDSNIDIENEVNASVEELSSAAQVLEELSERL